MQLAVSTSQNHSMLRRRKNVWYSVKDGNWSDPNTWMSNALDKRLITTPQPGDDVYINHTIDYDNSLGNGAYNGFTFNYIIGNLFIHTNGKLTGAGAGNQCKLVLYGNIQCDGGIDFSTVTTSVFVFEIQGVLNYINSFTAGNKATISFNSPFSYSIPTNITYYNLSINGGGVRTIASDLTVTNLLNISIVSSGNLNPAVLPLNTKSTLELGAFNATVKNVNVDGTWSKTGSGTVNISGSVNMFNVASGTLSFTGNPTVNISAGGGFTGDCRGGINLGSGTVNVNGNSTWSINNAANVPTNMGSFNTTIASGVTLTIQSINGISSNLGGWINMGTINGASGTSTLNIDGTLGYGNANTVMATGVFNYNHSGNSNIYVASGVSLTLPISLFYDLTVVGTATLGANTTVSHNLTISGTLQLSTFDFTESGTITNNGSLLKSGAGTVNINVYSSPNSTGKLDFSAGNPTVNISGNFTGDIRTGLNFGSATVNILQSINFGMWTAANAAPTISSNLLIASGKILTNTGLSSTTGGITTTGTITGADGTAIFDNRSVMTYNNATAPMATGKLYCNQAANTFIYALAGNQDIQVLSDPTSPGYYNLQLSGSGSTKRLLGNVSVKHTYTLDSGATLNSNGFALTNP